eukprot:g10577.t1
MADGDVSVDQRKAFLTAAELGLQDVVRRELQGSGQQEVIGLLHDHGVLLEALDRNGRTPLHLACEHGRLEAAAILLERGCQADVQDACGRTCLHLAVCSQEPRLCHLLLSSCQSLVRRCDGKGRSPLSYAVMNSTSSVAETSACYADSFCIVKHLAWLQHRKSASSCCYEALLNQTCAMNSAFHHFTTLQNKLPKESCSYSMRRHSYSHIQLWNH